MQRRGGLVVQQLSQTLGGLRVYRELSRLLQARGALAHARHGTPGAACVVCWPCCTRCNEQHALMCSVIPPSLLQEEDDPGFAGAVVQALNLILLTSSQLQVWHG